MKYNFTWEKDNDNQTTGTCTDDIITLRHMNICGKHSDILLSFIYCASWQHRKQKNYDTSIQIHENLTNT